MVKHNVKGNRDVIFKGEIYRPINGMVELPERVNNSDITPIEDTEKNEAVALSDLTDDELKNYATGKGIAFAPNIGRDKLITRIQESETTDNGNSNNIGS